MDRCVRVAVAEFHVLLVDRHHLLQGGEGLSERKQQQRMDKMHTPLVFAGHVFGTLIAEKVPHRAAGVHTHTHTYTHTHGCH